MQQRLYESEHIFGDEGVAFGGGVDSVGLNGSGYVVDVGENEGQQRDAELFGGERVSLVDGLNVVLPVVGRERDARERNFDARVLERGDDLVKIGAGGGDGQAAKHVVASELNDGDGGMGGEDVVKPIDAIFGGVSADAHVEDAIMVAA